MYQIFTSSPSVREKEKSTRVGIDGGISLGYDGEAVEFILFNYSRRILATFLR